MINGFLGCYVMKKKVSSLVVAMALGMLTAVISGCATNRVDLADSGVLTLEQQTTGKVYIAWCSAYEDGSGFIVTGVLRRYDHVGLPIKTHVDVTILSCDRTIIDESRSSVIYIPRNAIGRSQNLKRFRVRFPNIPPQGSLVRLVSHSGPHDDTI